MVDVLVIDDNPRICKLLRMLLEGGGHTVQAARDGGEGLDRFCRHRPHVVITNMIMPRCDGIQTIGMLRSLDSSVPIIAMSGGSDDVLSLARASGAVATLAKPFDASDLLSAIAIAIGGVPLSSERTTPPP